MIANSAFAVTASKVRKVVQGVLPKVPSPVKTQLSPIRNVRKGTEIGKFGTWAKRACNCSFDSSANSKGTRDARDSDSSYAMRQACQETEQEERGKRWKFKIGPRSCIGVLSHSYIFVSSPFFAKNEAENCTTTSSGEE
ncbi:unnamed protein product [Larinioides sclopetarius]|uniref:Uncharacterized protein n=1 Tax=Larinioides sclopetarius TaxID=280406 RepID=A0AAV1Z0X0_9ARAC